MPRDFLDSQRKRLRGQPLRQSSAPALDKKLPPSALEKHLVQTAPSGFTIPEPLCNAWSFMEAQGWNSEDADRNPILTPYPGESQLGPVFSANLSIRGWLNPEAPGTDRLVPIAEIDGSGGLALIWIDDSGEPRFVGLSTEGPEGVRLADTAVDFLRLVAIGYREFTEFEFGAEPGAYEDEEENSVGAHAQFRAWVEDAFKVTVLSCGRWRRTRSSMHGSAPWPRSTASDDLSGFQLRIPMSRRVTMNSTNLAVRHLRPLTDWCD